MDVRKRLALLVLTTPVLTAVLGRQQASTRKPCGIQHHKEARFSTRLF